jgi:hypothetical protein
MPVPTMFATTIQVAVSSEMDFPSEEEAPVFNTGGKVYERPLGSQTATTSLRDFGGL